MAEHGTTSRRRQRKRPGTRPKPDGRGRAGVVLPPFEPGNAMAVQHGANSERLVAPLAQRIVADLQGQATASGSGVSYLSDPTYLGSVNALARVEARIALVSAWLEEHGGDIDAEGAVRAAATLLNALEAAASRERSKLGLDPVSRVKLLAALQDARRDADAAAAQRRLRERAASREAATNGTSEVEG